MHKCMYVQDQMAQEIRARYKELNRKRPGGGSDEQSKRKKIQKIQTPQVRASNCPGVNIMMH